MESVIAGSEATASDELSKTRRAVLGAKATSILIKTVKHDRYLVDVFIGDEYINNQLLGQGLAVHLVELIGVTPFSFLLKTDEASRYFHKTGHT